MSSRRPARRSERAKNAGAAIISRSDFERIKSDVLSGSIKAKSTDPLEEKKSTLKMKKVGEKNGSVDPFFQEMYLKIDNERLRKRENQGSKQFALPDNSNPLLKNAQRHMKMEHDKVKAMYSLMRKAEALHGREAQIDAKKKREQLDAKVDDRWHKVQMKILEKEIELNRLHKERNLQQDAAIAKAQAVQRASIEKEKMLERERIIQEGLQLKKSWEAQQKEEERLAQKRIEIQKIRSMELVKANDKALKMKMERARLEQLEEKAILRYLREKQRQELRAEEELKKEIRRKNERHLKLLNAQEKASDKQAEADAERAEREQEEYELKQLALEEAAVIKKEKLKQQMLAGLAKQVEWSKRKEIEKEWDRMYLKNLQKEQAIQLKKEALEREERKLAALRHQQEVLEQVERKEKLKELANNDKYLADKAYRKEISAEEEMLKTFKQELLDQMKQKGIGEQYMRDLIKYDPLD